MTKRDAIFAHAEACRQAVVERRPRPLLPPELKDLHGIDLRGSNLSGCDLRGSNLSNCYLNSCDLSRCNLSGCNLRDSNLSGSNLVNCDLSYSALRGSNLSRSDLSCADLRGSNLSGSNLRDSDLRGTILVGCDLHDCDLRGSDLRDSDLSDSGCRVWISDKYTAYTVPGENGRILHFGCERHTLDVWEEKVKELCERYEPVHAARYEAEIQALVALCRVIPEGR